MITTAWMMDVDRDANYLECRKEEFGNEPRENKVDVVKVYFCSGTDIILAKSEKLEMAIARTIFSNREKYGKVLTAQFEIFKDAIYFQTATFAFVGGKE